MAEWLAVKGEVKVVNGVKQVPLLKGLKAEFPALVGVFDEVESLVLSFDKVRSNVVP